MNFIFQTGPYNQCAFPFVHAVYDACIQQKNDFSRILKFCKFEDLETLELCIDDFENWCPVGSVEFVHKWLSLCGLQIPKPINTPKELYKATGLNPRIVTRDSTSRFLYQPVFIKNIDTIKHPLNGVCEDILPAGDYLVTDYLRGGFVAEYRAFIFKGFVQKIVKYSGSAGIGNIDLEFFVDDCIRTWNTNITAYTIDVGINYLEELCVIECHNFYSCGTYGFTGYYVLPQMCASWYYQYVINNKIKVGE